MLKKNKIRLLSLILTVSAFFSACSFSGNEKSGSTRIDAPLINTETDDYTVIKSKSRASSDSSSPVSVSKSQAEKISFLAAGDNIIHSNVYEDASKRATGDAEYDFSGMYTDIAPLISSADIAFVNQETPIAGKALGYSGYPNFNSPEEAGNALVGLGFNVVNIANNHMLDKSEKGLLNAISHWESKQNVLLIGGYHDAADYDNIRVFKYSSVKIAFLSYTYGTNGMALPAGSKHIIPLINDSDIIRQIALAKKAGDLVFVSIHWGVEDSFDVTAEQERVAALMAENGVDVIIGSHPHVVERIEWKVSKSGHRTLVVYSLGNLLSTMLYARNMVGGIVTFDIISQNGSLSIENPLFIPVVCHYDKNRLGLQVYLLENYTQQLAQAHGAQKYGAFTLETLKKFVTQTVNPEFLPDYLKTD